LVGLPLMYYTKACLCLLYWHSQYSSSHIITRKTGIKECEGHIWQLRFPLTLAAFPPNADVWFSVLTSYKIMFLKKLIVAYILQELFYDVLVRNPKVHYRVHKSPSLASLICQIKPFHLFKLYSGSVYIYSTSLRFVSPLEVFTLLFWRINILSRARYGSATVITGFRIW
jgi:hypothetical protein